MSKKVFLIHGFEGTPNGGWRPYVMAELEKQNIYACAFSMPSPDAPQLEEWLEEMHRHVVQNHGDDIYFVGHYLGGTAILRYLEKYDSTQIKGVVIVSAPCHPSTDERVKSFLLNEFNWSKMRNNKCAVIVIHGDNDPVVPVADAEKIAAQLGGELIIITDGQHLNGSAGFFELPEIVSSLSGMMK